MKQQRRALSGRVLSLSLLVTVLLPIEVVSAQKGKKAAAEWAKGVAFTTDWKTAIDQAKSTGKILFIYNGWQRKGV